MIAPSGPVSTSAVRKAAVRQRRHQKSSRQSQHARKMICGVFLYLYTKVAENPEYRKSPHFLYLISVLYCLSVEEL